MEHNNNSDDEYTQLEIQEAEQHIQKQNEYVEQYSAQSQAEVTTFIHSGGVAPNQLKLTETQRKILQIHRTSLTGQLSVYASMSDGSATAARKIAEIKGQLAYNDVLLNLA